MLKVAKPNVEGLVITTGGEGEKVNLKICLAGELKLGLKRKRRKQ